MSGTWLLEAVELTKCFGAYQRGGRRSALAGASLAIPAGGGVALVGASGSGKTTMALCLAGQETPSGGQIRYRGNTIWPARAWQPRRSMQLVRQDSPLAFHPGWTLAELLEEPLLFARPALSGKERRAQVERWAESAGLDRPTLERTASQVSGGQRQRLAVARALAVDELELLLLDEPLPGLDAVAAAELTALVLHEQQARGFALLYITHDLARAGELASSVAVIHEGVIVETAPMPQFFAAPVHPASRLLIEARI